jgi:putative membrane protein
MLLGGHAMPESSAPSPDELPSATPDATWLRDSLATDRTELANERTLLAYVRTALAFAITGGTVLHLLTGPLTTAGGVLLLLAGAATAVIGVWRYGRMHARLAASRTPRERAR